MFQPFTDTDGGVGLQVMLITLKVLIRMTIACKFGKNLLLIGHVEVTHSPRTTCSVMTSLDHCRGDL